MGIMKRFELWLSMTAVGGWITKVISAQIDPFLFRLSGGRFTSIGPVVIPQLLLTTTGRKSGRPRNAQLVYTDVDGIAHIVASNFGGEHHPAWSYNLDANPSASMQLRGEKQEVTAEQLSEKQKNAIWDRLVDNIPNYAVYKERTGRNIKAYRLLPRQA